ncbi:TA system VapC family ribonuclease toxin [Aeromicrobium sp. CF4.19]|uniref:TA system VapC family ribonuclease toxin n=1 Tax=Aeromicrobium sp. CF4.19 TaxID=3373082 RepID=UPI003EE61F7E
MTSCLPDVNVLIALIDPTHVHHETAHRWFSDAGRGEWISVPLTQNGVLRIVSHPRYPNVQPLRAVVDSLRSLTSIGDHRFEPDSISLLDGSIGPMLTSSQVTDTYLLALAGSLGARLVTLDRKIVTTAVPDGTRIVDVIG